MSDVMTRPAPQEPWKVAKDDSPLARERLATILYTCAEALRAGAVLNPDFQIRHISTIDA